MGVIIGIIIVLVSYIVGVYYYKHFSEKLSRIFGKNYMGSDPGDPIPDHPDARVAGTRKQTEPREKHWCDPEVLNDADRVERLKQCVAQTIDLQRYEIVRIAYDPKREELVAIVKNIQAGTYLRKYESTIQQVEA